MCISVFIPLELIGGGFEAFCHALPFYQAVPATKLSPNGDFIGMLPHLGIVLAYAAAIYIIAILVFRHKMKGDKA